MPASVLELATRLADLGVATGPAPDGSPRRLHVHPGRGVLVHADLPEDDGGPLRVSAVLARGAAPTSRRLCALLLRQTAVPVARFAVTPDGDALAVVDLRPRPSDTEIRVALWAVVNAVVGWEADAAEILDARPDTALTPGADPGNGVFAHPPDTLHDGSVAATRMAVAAALPGWTTSADAPDDLVRRADDTCATVDPDGAGVTFARRLGVAASPYDERLAVIPARALDLACARVDVDEWSGAVVVSTWLPARALFREAIEETLALLDAAATRAATWLAAVLDDDLSLRPAT